MMQLVEFRSHILILVLASLLALTGGHAYPLQPVDGNHKSLKLEESISVLGPDNSQVSMLYTDSESKKHTAVTTSTISPSLLEEATPDLEDTFNKREFLDYKNIENPIDGSLIGTSIQSIPLTASKTVQLPYNVAVIKKVSAQEAEPIKMTKKVYSIPRTETAELTRLITGNETPTFMANKVVMPIEKKSNDPKVLARYNILVPIYIPPLKYSHASSNGLREMKVSRDLKFVPLKKTRTEVDTLYAKESPKMDGPSEI